MAPNQPTAGQEPPVSRAFTDRIRADTEMVEQVLDPGRTRENVQFPDPAFPGDSQSSAPGSIAGMKMARRTDAGLRQAVGQLGGAGPRALLWVAVAVLAAVVLLVFMLT